MTAPEAIYRTLVLFWLCLGHVPLSSARSRPKPSIAIIGAGIGGSTGAYFLREMLGDDVDITMYEKSDKAGGRTDHIIIDDEVYETGASIIYTGNAHIYNLTSKVGLKRIDPAHKEGSGTGLWDGNKFVLTTSDWTYVNMLKMAWRYGWSLLKVRSMVMEALEKFGQIYDHQAQGKWYATPEDLWGDVGLLNLTGLTIADYMVEKMGQSGSLIGDELVYGANRVNYNQGNGLNALAGVVSLCPAVTGELFKIDGGNSRLSEELLKKSLARLHLGTRVTKIAGSKDSGYSVYGAELEKLGHFDAVIVAAPIGLAEISFDILDSDGNPEHPSRPLLPIKFQTTHTTYIKGRVDHAYFGLGFEDEVPATVLLTSSAEDSPFSSLALHAWAEHNATAGVGIYKVFSRQELWTGFWDKLFVQGSWDILYHRKWRAYPVLTPREAFSPSRLYVGHPLWYVSSLEEGVSAMEISAISAKNAALGVAKEIMPKLWPPNKDAPVNEDNRDVDNREDHQSSARDL